MFNYLIKNMEERLMKTKINKYENDWLDAKNKCRNTVNKEHTDNEPNSKFKTQLLISEHSPCRLIKVNWIWKNIKSWISVHWSRHKWECFISTQRTDRTGVDRDKEPQGALVTFEGEANAQNLIDTMRKRLCFQASKETRELAEDFKLTISKDEVELADVLVPNCIYRAGCPEFEECGYWNKFKEKYNGADLLHIETRYKLYNGDFYIRKLKEDK